MSSTRVLISRRCTMICATILLCYLFTCCTHLVTLAASESQHQPQDTHLLRQPRLPALAADRGGGGTGGASAALPTGSEHKTSAAAEGINWDNKDDIRIEDLKHDNVHRLMSEQDLRRTFQVDSHDQVPEYEILKLTVNDDGSHLISPISDLGELTTTTTTTTTNNYNNNNDYHDNRFNEEANGPRQRQRQETAAASDRRTHNPQTEAQQHDNQSPSIIGVHHRSSRESENAIATTLKTSQEKHSSVRHKRSSSSTDAGAWSLGPRLAGDAESSISGARQQSGGDTPADANSDKRDHAADSKLIVMNLSTFGKDFKLRLKRNTDFQQRIKDMKMYMAESTGDGKLRYYEINPASQHQHHHHEQRRQGPHKREAATATDAEPIDSARSPSSIASGGGGGLSAPIAAAAAGDAEAATKESGQRRPAPKKKLLGADDEHISSSSAANVWNIGTTYHDEDNLAALLIDHDKKTGQLQVDGTIGNDFVIKPMPQATMDALLVKRQQELLRRQQQQAPTLATEQLASTSRLDRLAPGSDGGGGGSANNNAAAASQTGLNLASSGNGGVASSQPQRPPQPQQQQPASNKLPISTSAIQHMHDDDPHDDDEMFLDEDEAIELAHLQSSASIESNHTGPHPAGAGSGNPQQLLPHKQPQQPRTLTKAASERKWRKYRKLLAQTQVPKPGQMAERQQAADLRARRHATAGERPDDEEAAAEQARHVQVSHHIIYRQKPSSEGSSSEHKHSFMVSPSDYMNSAASAATMERLAVDFSPQRIHKRSAARPADGDATDDNMIESAAAAKAKLSPLAPEYEADFLHDPLGGQFYLEPGSVTGVERAGHSDWSLMSRPRGGRFVASPPYATLNGTAAGANQSYPYATNETAGSRGGRFKRQAPHRLSAAPPGGQVRRKRQAPDTVWPEVLLVVDYDSFLLHGGDSRDVKRYFVSFWNGVDLRYKLLVHPHIRISLAGMIVAKDRDATPYLERNRLRAPNADAVDAAGALTDMGKYLYREDRLPTYDLAVVITKLDMCRRRYEGGRCNRGTAGFAYVGGACVVNKRLEKVNSVAIIEDSGGFSGIIVAAHEVGHLLGCVHDGSPPPTYLGGPGATHCPWEDGFIMSDLRHTERGFRWSQCSVEQFKHFLNGETATCLYNYPHESQMLHRLLPGTMLSLDEQCKRDRGTNACFKDARVCAQLFCFDSASGYCVSYRPAAEGSPCGEGQVCRNGKCVGEIENIIPDYTHQSQTVVARGRSHPVSRLADNGLSASSTSTATSSPDNKLAPNAGGGSNSQLTSRMDTFAVDTPTIGDTYSPAAHPFGGRYSAAAGGGVTLPGTTSINHHATPIKSANLIDFGGANLNLNSNRRTGQQAVPKAGAINQNTVKPYGSYQTNNNYHHLNHNSQIGSTTSALYTSASTMSHQADPSLPSSVSSSYPHSSMNGGNNLLTSVSANQLTKAKNKQQLQHQQLYDNQRILYQPITQQESQYNNNQNIHVNSNNNYNRNVNHHQPSSSSYLNGPSASHRLYTSSFSPQTSATS